MVDAKLSALVKGVAVAGDVMGVAPLLDRLEELQDPRRFQLLYALGVLSQEQVRLAQVFPRDGGKFNLRRVRPRRRVHTQEEAAAAFDNACFGAFLRFYHEMERLFWGEIREEFGKSTLAAIADGLMTRKQAERIQEGLALRIQTEEYLHAEEYPHPSALSPNYGPGMMAGEMAEAFDEETMADEESP